jgi:antitoxin VapB
MQGGEEKMAGGKANLFWSGRSQAVRLPRDFRFQGREVWVRRHGNGVILDPLAADWTWLDYLVGKRDRDFVEAVEEQPHHQDPRARSVLSVMNFPTA